MSLTAHRVIQYIALILLFILAGGAYWYFSARGAVSNKTASKTGLVGYWSFDEGSGTLAGDASGSGNTGTLTNGPTWADGKLGKALNFDGVNDYVDVPSVSGFNSITTQITFSAWVKSPTPTASRMDIIQRGGISDNWWFNLQNGLVSFYADNITGGVYKQSATAITSTDWVHTSVTYDGSNIRFYINGVLDNTIAATGIFNTNGIIVNIGRNHTNLSYFSGLIDDVRIYNRALTSTEVTNLYNLGAAKLNASKNASLTDGLVGLWSFDGADLSGTTAYDRSGAGNNGTLTGGPAATIGKIGQGMSFDGVDDVITTPSRNLTANYTIAMWYKNAATPGTALIDQPFVWNSTGNQGISFSWDHIQASFSQAWAPFDDAYAALKYTTSLQANTWYHMVLTYDGTTARAYLNGIQEVSSLESAPTDPGTEAIYIGAGGGGTTSFDDGLIDDVRVYNRALSATEVQDLYALGDADKINSSMAQPQGTGRLDSGLQSYWSLDENTGTTTTDASTNALTGTLTNGPAWTAGQIGYGIDFDGTDDSITTPDADVLDVVDGRNFTLSGWFNRDTFTTDDTLVAKRNGITAAENGYIAYIDDATDKLTFEVSDGTDEYQLESVSTFTATGWHHFSLVWNDSVSAETKLYIDGRAETATATGTFANVNSLANALTFALGAESDAGNPFDGKLDEVRLYNRTLTADEVAQLYRLTTPTSVDTALKGYWSFDGADLSGTTASDRSGSGNDGTLTGGPVAAIGKMGQALNFDGVDDYVQVADNNTLDVTTELTISSWVKKSRNGQYERLVSKQNNLSGGSTGQVWLLQTSAVDGIQVAIGGAATWGNYYVNSTASAITDTNWHFVTGTYTAADSKVRIYIDGVLNVTATPGTSGNDSGTLWSGNLHASTGVLNIGRLDFLGGTYYAQARIDDVRVYNRALTATEVTALYNLGR